MYYTRGNTSSQYSIKARRQSLFSSPIDRLLAILHQASSSSVALTGSSSKLTLELGQVTMEALDLNIGQNDGTLLLAMENLVGKYSKGFIVQTVLYKKFPL